MKKESAKSEVRIIAANRITIPKHIREKMDLEPGDSIAFDIQDGKGFAYISAIKHVAPGSSPKANKPKR